MGAAEGVGIGAVDPVDARGVADDGAAASAQRFQGGHRRLLVLGQEHHVIDGIENPAQASAIVGREHLQDVVEAGTDPAQTFHHRTMQNRRLVQGGGGRIQLGQAETDDEFAQIQIDRRKHQMAAARAQQPNLLQRLLRLPDVVNVRDVEDSVRNLVAVRHHRLHPQGGQRPGGRPHPPRRAAELAVHALRRMQRQQYPQTHRFVPPPFRPRSSNAARIAPARSPHENFRTCR